MITVQSNFLEVRETILSIFADLSNIDKVLNRATFDSFVMIKQRIHQRGEKTDGTQIGKYSTRKSIKVKKGNTTSIASYAEFRQQLGRQIEYIDLTLTGDMLDRGFGVIKIDESTIAIGFINDESSNKARKLEQRFGAVFQNSEEELKDVIDTVLKDINDIINEA